MNDTLNYFLHILCGVFEISILFSVIFLTWLIGGSALSDWNDKRKGLKDKNTIF